jgi:hypothetical protein
MGKSRHAIHQAQGAQVILDMRKPEWQETEWMNSDMYVQLLNLLKTNQSVTEILVSKKQWDWFEKFWKDGGRRFPGLFMGVPIKVK